MRKKYGTADHSTPLEVRPMTVKEVAERMNRSVDWVRDYFRRIDGVLVIPSTKGHRRGTRRWVTLLIPVDVFDRVIASFRVAA
jgi:hypothetical protein